MGSFLLATSIDVKMFKIAFSLLISTLHRFITYSLYRSIKLKKYIETPFETPTISQLTLLTNSLLTSSPTNSYSLSN